MSGRPSGARVGATGGSTPSGGPGACATPVTADVKRSVLGQDRPLELLQRLAGLQPELFGKELRLSW